MFVTKPKNRSENLVDFKKSTRAQLQELLDRQDKILANRRFVEGLPDKGEKIKQFRLQIESELIKKCYADRLCSDMASLNIGKEQLDTLEWTGKHVPRIETNSSQADVNDENVLKMLISHSGVNQDKIIIEEKPDEPLIKPSDLIEEPVQGPSSEPIRGPSGDGLLDFDKLVEKYAKNLCGRIDTYKPEKKEHLLLYKPVKLDKYSKVKAEELSLKESVTLQIIQEKKLKEIQEERTKERSFLKFNTKNYRDVKSIDFDVLEDSSEDDDELREDDFV